MPVTSSGQVSLNDLHVEAGGTSGTECSFNDTDIRGLIDKASGAQMAMNEWYGAANTFSFTISSHTQQGNLSTMATAAGWDGSASIICTISSGIYMWSDSTGTAGFTVNVAGAKLINNGYIIGKGGSSNGKGAGGPALSITAASTTIQNNSGAYIAGGGGGGGDIFSSTGGGGGGAGGGTSGYQGSTAGGAIGSAGNPNSAFAGIYYSGQYPDGRGGAAGGGGACYDNQGSDTGGSWGGSGGRVMPPPSSAVTRQYAAGGGGYGAGQGGIGVNWSNGINFYGGQGGSFGNAGSSSHFGGGGGWGAAGGNSGGAGGAAITGSARTLTNNGTIYGST